MNDLFQLASLVFNNSDMAKKVEWTQRDKQKTQMMTKYFSTQRPSKRPGFLGQFGHGIPHGPWVPRQNLCASCGYKGRWSKDCDWYSTQPVWQGPLCLWNFHNLKTDEAQCLKCLCLRDATYITNAKPQVVTEMAGHLIKFFIDTGAAFSVITKKVENLNDYKN